MSAAETLYDHRALIADARAGIERHASERRQAASQMGTDPKARDRWAAAYRLHTEHEALLRDLVAVEPDLRRAVEAERHAAGAAELAAQREASSIKARARWAMDGNAYRLFNEIFEQTPAWLEKAERQGDKARHAHADDDLCEHMVPTGVLRRGAGPDEPVWVVVRAEAFGRWIAENSQLFLSADATRDAVRQRKQNSVRAFAGR